MHKTLLFSFILLGFAAFANLTERSRVLESDETIAVYGRLTVSNALVNLRGHTLHYTHVTALDGLGEITDLSENRSQPGTLILDIEGEVVQTMLFSGNLKVVKSGSGTMAFREEQSYTGGTEIRRGTATIAGTKKTLKNLDFSPFGQKPSVISIYSEGCFNPRGTYNWPNAYTIELHGGEIINNTKNELLPFDASLTLFADSRFSAIPKDHEEKTCGFSGSVNLRGQTLLVKAESPIFWGGTLSNGFIRTYGTSSFTFLESAAQNAVRLDAHHNQDEPLIPIRRGLTFQIK